MYPNQSQSQSQNQNKNQIQNQNQGQIRNPDRERESVQALLHARLSHHVQGPFHILFEDGLFLFEIPYGREMCRVRVDRAAEIVDILSGEDQGAKEALFDRLSKILCAAVSARENTVLTKDCSYEGVRGDLILRPFFWDRWKDMLSQVPCIRIGDIALALYAVMSRQRNDYFTSRIRKDRIEGWNMSVEQVLGEALVNASFLYPPRLYDLEELIQSGGVRSGGRFMGQGANPIRVDGSSSVLTTSLEINGALAAFYPGVGERIGELLQDDFFIAFTSVHEAQIHPAGKISPEIVEHSLRDVNRRCNGEQDFLTDHVYRCSQNGETFSMLQNGVFTEVKPYVV